MPLTLVLGPANSAKAGAVLGAYTAAAARRGALLVVPTALDVEYYTRELCAPGALIGPVLTFSGLANTVAARTGYRARRLSPLQRDRVLRRVLAGLELELLHRSAGAPGFVVAAGALIAELQRSLITPQRFVQALAAWAREDGRRAVYAREVGALYQEYVRELGRIERVDAEQHAWRALDALRARPGRWGATDVFFYGFDDLLAIERDAIETLARIVGVDVTVSLTYEAGRAALSARAEVVEELRVLAQRVQELPPLDEYYAAPARGTLHHLERFLFEPPPTLLAPGPAVRLLEAGGERAEAELIGGEVLKLLRRGVAAEEIVVVTRSLTRSAPLLGRVLRSYGITVADQHRVPLTHTPLGRAVRALARCAWLDEQDATAGDLLDLLRAPGRLRRPEIADALEAEIRRAGLRSATEARARLRWNLDEIDALADAEDRAGALAAHARRLFAAPRRGTAELLDPAGELDARALTVLLGALADLEELGERPTAAEALELLEGLEVPAGEPAGPGAVLLAEPLTIRARRFRVVFVCGLNEGEFPLRGRSEPFLPDGLRRELALAAGLRLRPGEDALARERYLFYACVSRASEQLFLSYRSSDEEGNLALPSPFIADVGDLFEPDWAARRERRLLADVVWDPAAAPTARERARAAAAASAADKAPPSPVHTLGEQALTHVRHKDIVSGGALESYADCPVRWLMERQLSPERFAPDPDPMVRGSFMHEALEAVLVSLEGPVTPENLPDALRILDEVVAEVPATIAPGRSEAVRTAALRSIEADLRRYLVQEAGDGCDWEPEGLELRFGFEGEEGSLPAVALGEGSERVFLRGVVDRVDVDPDRSGRALVRDYKSASKRPEQQGARWSTDRRLQVALYMIAVRELLGLDPVAGLYQPLGGGDLRPRGVFLKGAPIGSRVLANDGRDREELEAVLDDARTRAVSLAARLRSGVLEPCPETCSRDGCRYPGICRSS
jgi:ATP-dependent helicase/DNAse subunit B